jgi:hypothetical protein
LHEPSAAHDTTRVCARLTAQGDRRPDRPARVERPAAGGPRGAVGTGTQAALVAIPFQAYALTHPAGPVGLFGLVELGPLVAASLLDGAGQAAGLPP